MSLTLKAVERAKLRPGKYYDGHGLYLLVRTESNAQWFLRYQRAGRERSMSLGTLHDFTLPEARERARKARQQLADGVDPLDAKRAAALQNALHGAKAKTFEQCAREFFADNAERWSNAKHRAQFISTLESWVFPVIGDIGVADVDVGRVLSVFEKRWEHLNGKTFWDARPETARRVLYRIHTVLAWATVRGLRTGDNPAVWKGHLSTQLKPRGKSFAPVKHHPALPFDEMSAFMGEVREREGIAPRALEFAILCAARTGAVIGATWDEIDFPAKVWTVPPDRAGTKIEGAKPRRVPLSPRAIEILSGLPRERGNPHVFIGPKKGRGLSSGAMTQLLARMGRTGITVHGFRSTFKDWVSERTSYPNHVSEAALWHTVADKVEAAYRRGDLFEKRRKLMADWARFCTTPASRGTVVPMRKAEAV
jgi:integrase